MTPSEKKLNDKIDALTLQVEELLRWKKDKIRQQISLPLDDSSKNIINNI